MKAVYTNAAVFQFCCQFKSVHDLRQLAAAIGIEALVALFHHEVVEVERRLPDGSDVHDAGMRRFSDEGQEALGQQKMRKVVDAEAQLDAVVRQFTPGT